MAERRWPHRATAALALVAVVALVLGVATRAGAQDATLTRAEAADLAGRAATDDAALAALRAVRRIDGEPTDLRPVTAGVEGAPDRVTRLRALAAELRAGSAPTGGTATADRARADARSVLAGRAYQDRSPPRPFRGALRWLGDRLAPLGRLLSRTFGPPWRAAASVPGGSILVILAAGGLLAFVTVVLIQRRGRVRVVGRDRAARLVDLDADPAALEAEADRAEAAGDLSLAVRRHYEAGLLRLVRAGRLDLRPETTPGRVAREVGGEAIAALTRTFEEVVYGGRAAGPADVAESRTRWLDLLGERARR